MAKRPKREQSVPGELIPVEMLAVPSDGFAVLRFLDDYRGVLTHWGKKRALACPGVDQCPANEHRGRTIWKGYAPAEYWRDVPFEDWCPVVFEVTERLAEFMNGHTLRGEVWKVQRQVGRNGTKEVVGECVDEINAERLRKSFSVEPVVWRVFGTRSIAFDVEPYLPPRQFVVASAGDRPKGVSDPREKVTSTTGPLPSFGAAFRARMKAPPPEQGGADPRTMGDSEDKPSLPSPSTNGKH